MTGKVVKSESEWKNVWVLDANDLEHWLELAPAVDVWLSTLMGRRPSGVIDITRYWQALSSIAELPLPADLFLTSRETAIESIRQFLQQPASSAFLRSEGWDDGRLALTKNQRDNDHTPFLQAGVPTLLLTWRDSSEDNWPDGASEVVEPYRLGVAGRMVSLAAMMSAK